MEFYNDSLVSADTLPAEAIPTFFIPDYIESNNAAEIDRGIRDTIKGIRVSILAMSLGLAKIKANSLYRDLGFYNITQYVQKLCEETKMDRSNIFKWLRIGEVYLRYKNDLESAGFTDTDGPTKLPYLERALKKNQKQEVFDNIKNMSVREFASFAKGQTVTNRSAVRRGRWKIKIQGNNIYVDGKLAVIISKKVDPRVSDYFMRVNRVVCEALEKERVMLPVLLRNLREVNHFQPAVERLKAHMG